MALKAILTKIEFEALNPAFKTEYKVGADGTATLDVIETGGFALENVTGLRTALSRERENVAELTRVTSAFKDIDPAAAKAALAKAEEIKNWKPDDKAKEIIASQVGQVEAKYKAEAEKDAAKYKKTRGQLEATLVDSVIAQACAQHDGILALLSPYVRTRVRVEEDSNGNLVTRVLDEKGQPLISKKPNSTDFMGISEFVEIGKTNPETAAAYKSSNAAGSGGGHSRPAGSQGQVSISYQDALNPAAYRAAKEAAAKSGQAFQVGDLPAPAAR